MSQNQSGDSEAVDNEFVGKRVLFTHEMHSFECNGEFYNPNSVLSYKNLQFYLHSFPDATAVVRCQGRCEKPEDGWLRIDGDHIDIEPMPDLRRPHQIVTKFLDVNKAVGRALEKTDCCCLRLPGVAGLAVAFSLILRRRKYGIEFVGHATESIVEMLAKQGKKPGLAVKLIEWANRLCVRKAVAVAYRSDYLRKAYPHGNPDRQVIFSGAQLHKEVITQPKTPEQLEQRPFRVVYTGRISPEKGCHVLLDGFAKAQSKTDVPMVLRMVGMGDFTDTLKARAAELGIAGKVEFTGLVKWGPELFSKLDDSHLYVLPSLTEGMPRSLIEAMARGLPALGSNCGGIPELLAPEDLVTPGSVEEMTDRLLELAGNTEKLLQMSQRNFEASKQQWPENLDKAKSKFWRMVLKYTQK